MIRGVIFIAVLFLITVLSSGVFAHDETTPYGDYCNACSKYGACDQAASREESKAAVEDYYREKGMKIGSIRHRGRFIEFEIFKNGKLVDKVLFDRKSGRMRSTY